MLIATVAAINLTPGWRKPMKPIRPMIILAAACGALASVGATAQPSLLWADQFGSDGTDTGGGIMTFFGVAGAPGPLGDVYAFGKTDSDLGGPHVGNFDCFLAHYGADGEPLWFAHIGSNAEEDSGGAAPDGVGGVFVTGMTRGDLAGSAGKDDAFVARYGPEGGPAWIKQYGTSGNDGTTGAASDNEGGVYVGGVTSGSLFGEHAGHKDVHVARFDASGALIWGVQFGTNKQELSAALSPDGEDGVLVCGATSGFLAGPLVGSSDAFAARYDADGHRVWIAQFGGAEGDDAFAILSDEAGGAFVGGSAWQDGGFARAFLARIDGEGTVLWFTLLEDADVSSIGSLIADGQGGVIAAGNRNVDGNDVFVTHFDGDGVRGWTVPFGTPQNDGGALVACRLGGFFLVGATTGSLNGEDAWGSDAFVARFGGYCAADCDGSGDLALFDFLCYVNLFNEGDGGADCDQSGGLDLFDFFCFVNAFNAGC
jgi:hypothetical protein